MMTYRKYEAESMIEALARIRAELGPNAVIVSSRKKTIRGGGGISGLISGKTEVVYEVTAVGREPEKPAAPEPVALSIPEPAPRYLSAADYERWSENRIPFVEELPDYVSPTDLIKKTIEDAAGRVFRKAVAPISLRKPLVRPRQAALDMQGLRQPAEPQASAEQAASLIEPIRAELRELKDLVAKRIGSEKKTVAEQPAEIESRLVELRSMMDHMLEIGGEGKLASLPKGYRSAHRALRLVGVNSILADRIIERLAEFAAGKNIDDKTALAVSARLMRESIAETKGIELARNRPKVAAFVGPTGVGKTTTIAKLAARYKLAGKKVALFTVDTFRIGAVEQLKTYSELLRVPLEVLNGPASLADAVKRHHRADLILIDTAGRSQRDAKHLNELAGFGQYRPGGGKAEPDDKFGFDFETHLVLSAAADERTLADAAASFAKAIPPDSIIFTKLDEAVSLGAAYNAVTWTGLPMSYFTTGQRVPEDIEQADCAMFLRRLFRLDKMTGNSGTGEAGTEVETGVKTDAADDGAEEAAEVVRAAAGDEGFHSVFRQAAEALNPKYMHGTP